MGWQLNERHAAGEEANRIQTQLLAAQNERETAQAEIERLRAISGRLEPSVTQKNEADARAAETARAFAAWKKNIRSQLTAADYRWLDDSPFIRIPKSVLPELSEASDGEPFSSPGVVLSYARELMGLTPAERQSVEETLHRHFADMDERSALGIQETNSPLSGRMVAGRVFFYSMPGNDRKQYVDKTLAVERGILGEERWPLVQARLEDRGARGFGVLSLTLEGILEGNSSQELYVRVEPNDKGILTVIATWGGGAAGYGTGALSQFLPEGDPNRTEGSDGFLRGGPLEALRQNALAWLQEQAIARLGKGVSR